MNFLLKIVEGPNRGAEIALVEGVAVTLGKGDSCDIVLADPGLPDEPLGIEASSDAVSVNGERLEPFTVRTLGATSFAVGPADGPWEALKWPEEGKVPRGDAGSAGAQGVKDEAPRGAEEAPGAEAKEEPLRASEPQREGKRRHGCLGCLLCATLLVLVLAALAWIFRDKVRPYAEKAAGYAGKSLDAEVAADVPETRAVGVATLADVASRHALELVERNGQAKLSGNLATRAERLRATAEAYEARPGVELDLSDDESFKAAADDALFTLTEGAVKVVAATNRVLSIAGTSPSPFALKRILESLNADLPKLRGVDTTGVSLGALPGGEADEEGGDLPASVSRAARLASKAKSATSLPVCGILTAPYPCLVMRDGSRVLEGAPLGDSVILKIEADAVTVTNATGQFTWKP